MQYQFFYELANYSYIQRVGYPKTGLSPNGDIATINHTKGGAPIFPFDVVSTVQGCE